MICLIASRGIFGARRHAHGPRVDARLPGRCLLVFAILAGMLALFLWDRLRYDLIGLAALVAGVACGVVPTARAFSGFSSDVVPLIAGALVVSAAIGRSGAVDAGLALLVPFLRSPSAQVAGLAAAVALLSAFLKNVGALAIFLSIALQLAARHRRAPSELLIPLSFASLIADSMTLIGTSPNILVSGLRAQIEGRPSPCSTSRRSAREFSSWASPFSLSVLPHRRAPARESACVHFGSPRCCTPRARGVQHERRAAG